MSSDTMTFAEPIKAICPFLTEGQQIAGYTLDRFLHRSPSSIVWKAHYGDRTVVLKFPLSDGNVPMIEHEAGILGILHHDGFPHLVESIHYEGMLVMVIEFLSGNSLKERIKTLGHLSWQEAAQWGEDLARLISRLEREGIVHRDIKPGNVVLTAGRANLVDFGISQTSDEAIDDTVVSATPQFAPPEQLRGESTDSSADVYSLGATLFTAVNGTAPFTGATPAEIQSNVVRNGPAPLEVDVPDEFRQLVYECLEHNPADRPTAQKVADILHYLLVPAT